MDARPRLTTAQLAALTGIPAETLRWWRRVGRGPAYIREPAKGAKGTVRYRVADVEAWEESLLVKPQRGTTLP